jgi:hypothetical protein
VTAERAYDSPSERGASEPAAFTPQVLYARATMHHDADHILSVLDRCCEQSTFPMLDNGYVYLAATRLSLFRSEEDWALVTEVFGFSPRAGLPDVCVTTFASRLHERNPPTKYVSPAAYENYLATHPHDDARFFFPIEEGEWQDADDTEVLASDASEVVLRGRSIGLPPRDAYARHGIELADPERMHVFELCRSSRPSSATTSSRRPRSSG